MKTNEQQILRAGLRLQIATLSMRYSRQNREMTKTLKSKLSELRRDLQKIEEEHNHRIAELNDEWTVFVQEYNSKPR